MESKGIMVMQSGIVGSNTHRKLEIKEFRGFMLYDDLAPLIFINASDSQAGKMFSLIHEYIHLLFKEDDVFINDDLKNEDEKVKEIMEKDLENKKADSSGGNYYTTYKSHYSDNFIKTVIQGAESGDLSYTYAFNLLDAKAKTYDYFKEEIMSYVYMG